MVNQQFDTIQADFKIWWHFIIDPIKGDTIFLSKINNYNDYLFIKFPPKEDIFDGSNDEPCKNTKRTARSGSISMNGTVEHWMIELDYTTIINPFAVGEYFIPNAGANGGPGYADIVNVYTGEIFEIKPETQLQNGITELNRYIQKATKYCPNTPGTGSWIPGFLYPYPLVAPRVIPHPFPNKIIQAYLAQNGIILYRTVTGTLDPSPVPLPIPQSTAQRLKRFIEETAKKMGQIDIEEEIRVFLDKNPEFVNEIKVAAITTGVVIIVATIVEDIITLGGGIADDPASFYVAYRLITIAI